MHIELELMRYPLGRFQPTVNPGPDDRCRWIEDIAGIADTLRALTLHLTLEQLHTPYRSEGWTVLQVVHHLADSDANAYIRFKRALTEESPLAATFREDAFAALADYRDTPAETSIAILSALHLRLIALLRSMTPEQFVLTLTSPTHGRMTLDLAAERFAWHGRHHLAQIAALKIRMGWNA